MLSTKKPRQLASCKEVSLEGKVRFPRPTPEAAVPDSTDAVDRMRERLAELYPDLDTSAFGLTGRVLRVARALERHRAAHLKEFGLTPGDFDVLTTIRRIEGDAGVNPARLLQSVLITSGGLTKRLDRLESAQWVARGPDPHDRRGTLVRLTTQGRTMLDRALRSLLTEESELIGGAIPRRQRDQTAAALRRLALTLADEPQESRQMET
jgi:DNA-binding MarR family transcriptional regulator